MRDPNPSPRLPRFAAPPRKVPPRPRRRLGLLDLIHKLLTAGAALATILRVLF